MSTAVVAAAGLAGGAVVVAGLGRGAAAARLHRAGRPAPRRVAHDGAGTSALELAMRRAAPAGHLAPAAAVAALVATGAGVLAWIAAGLAIAVQLRLRRARQARRRFSETQGVVLEVCEVLAGEMAAGRTPAAALAAAADLAPDLVGEAAGTAALGGDPVPLLRAAGADPGAGGLRTVAAAWQLAVTVGAPPAPVLLGVVTEVRAGLDAAREVETHVAEVRATARLLAVLPVLGAGMGAALGAAPLDLVRTVPGQACLLGAVLLTATGLLWLDRLVRQAGPAGTRP